MQTTPKRGAPGASTTKIGDIAFCLQSIPTDQVSGDPEEAMGLSVSIETEGRPVEIKLIEGEVGVALSGAAAWAGGTFKLYRDGVAIKTRVVYAEKANVVGSLGTNPSLEFFDKTAAAGVHTYEMKVQYFGGTTSSQFYTQDYLMIVKEL